MAKIVDIYKYLDSERKGVLLTSYIKSSSKFVACYIDAETLEKGGVVQSEMTDGYTYLTEKAVKSLTAFGIAVYTYDKPGQRIGNRVYSCLSIYEDKSSIVNLGNLPVL